MLALHRCYSPSPVAVQSGHSSLRCMGPGTQTQQQWHTGSATPQHVWSSRPGIKPTSLAPEPSGKYPFILFFCLPEGTWKTASAQYWELSIVLNIFFFFFTLFCFTILYWFCHLVLVYSTSHTNAHSIPYHLDFRKCSQTIVKGASNNGLKLTYTHNYI